MKRLLVTTFFLTFISVICLSQTVYITKTGKKYHQQSCNYLRSSSIPIELSEAINRGLGACRVCVPAQEPNKPNQKPNSPSTPREIPKQTPQTNRCSAITKAGTQCSRAPRSNGLCWQHGG
jgi:hypothetical protein